MRNLEMIFSCLVGLADGTVVIIDGIEYDKKLWLVPSWLYHQNKAHAIPERMIRFDNLQYQKANEGEYRFVNIILPVKENELIKNALPDKIEYIDNALHVRIPTDQFPHK